MSRAGGALTFQASRRIGQHDAPCVMAAAQKQGKAVQFQTLHCTCRTFFDQNGPSGHISLIALELEIR
jgi:hypothetical protein